MEKQQFFDKVLYPATRNVYLSMVLNDAILTKKYLTNCYHLNTWRVINETYWNILSMLYYVRFKNWKAKTTEKDWGIIEECFSDVSQMLEKNPKTQFLFGNALTAADISFVSHAVLLLLPNSPYCDKHGLKFPSLEEVSDEYKQRTEKLRKSKAGKWAIEIYEKYRGRSLAKKLDAEAPEYNTDWSISSATLSVYSCNITMLFFIPMMIPFIIGMELFQIIIYWSAILLSSYLFNYMPFGIFGVIKKSKLLLQAFLTTRKAK
jgi:hypothetical protein